MTNTPVGVINHVGSAAAALIVKMKRESFGPRSERSQRLLDQMDLQLEELVGRRARRPVSRFKASCAARRRVGVPCSSAATAHRSSGTGVVPVLRWQQALEDRRGRHRDARCGAPTMVRDP
jgi:Transposase C of IS166 homeodomain